MDTETGAEAPTPADDVPPQPISSSAWLTIPNLISLGRLALTPVLGWLIVSEKTVIATVLFAAMGISDWVDGYLARRTNTVTDLGTTLDPVSDRVLVMVALVTMMMADVLPVWLGGIVLLREVVLSVAFLALARRGFGKPKVRRVGKTATFAILTALPALILGTEIEPLRTFGLVCFGIGAVLYYVAAYRYYQDVQTFLKHQRRDFGT
ncbi:MAG: CDP-alcohol phosphatidyltransferase family protein [Actinomycetota bacterium]